MANRQKRYVYVEGDEAAERFGLTLSHVLKISKEELAKRERAYQKSREHKDRPGPRRKSSR